jgi:hypothetical protein
VLCTAAGLGVRRRRLTWALAAGAPQEAIALSQADRTLRNRRKAETVRAEGWSELVADHFAMLDMWQVKPSLR